MIYSRDKIFFVSLLFLHFLLLISIINDFSLSYNEVKIIFDNNTFIGLLTNLSLYLFGQNDYAARLPFMLFYFGSAIVFYLLLDDYFKYKIDRLITIAIFLILPGVNTAALLINESIVVVFFTLLYLYLYKIREQECYVLLVFFLLIDNSFAILYLALFFYSLKKRDTFLLFFSLILFAISMSIYGFEIGGKPKGYFVDTFTIFASIFSPLLFIYFFYSIYRVGLKFERDMYWYISITALSLALVFSLRQKISVDDFAPFVVVAIPIMVKLFMHSYRVRLKEFRKKHFLFGGFSVLILVLNFMILFFSKELYPFFDTPNDNFAYKHHVVKELAYILKEKGIKNVYIDNVRYQSRLKFYGIDKGNDVKLAIKDIHDTSSTIEIKYNNIVVARFDILSNKL